MTYPPASDPADPPSFLKALGSCPHPHLVQAAHFTISRLDTDLSTRLASLGPDHQCSREHQAEEECKLKEEVEKAKLPYKSIVSLYELHQIYEGLVSTCSWDARTKKTLEVLNSFSDKHHVADDMTGTNVNMNPSYHVDVMKAVLDVGKHNTTNLDLSERLLCSLPTSLGHNLTHLVCLDLSRNQLKDLPRSIGDLDSLEVLDLQSNQLSSLPDAIGFLENLKTLNVSGNMLVDLPVSLGGCRELVELNASFNQLDHLPTRIGYDLQCLQILCVHSNKITVLAASISELKQLRVLDLHFNHLKSLPASLGNMSALEKLNISNNFSDFGGALPDTMGDLELLVELDMSFNQIRVLPDCIGALENLKALRIENNPLVVPPPEVVSQGTTSVLEYMSMRWKTAQTFDEDGCSSPIGLSNGLKVGFHGATCTGSSFVHWLACRHSRAPNHVNGKQQ